MLSTQRSGKENCARFLFPGGLLRVAWIASLLHRNPLIVDLVVLATLVTQPAPHEIDRSVLLIHAKSLRQDLRKARPALSTRSSAPPPDVLKYISHSGVQMSLEDPWMSAMRHGWPGTVRQLSACT